MYLMISWIRLVKASARDNFVLASGFMFMESVCALPIGELVVRHDKIFARSWRSPVVKPSKICLLRLLTIVDFSTSGTTSYRAKQT